MREIIVIDATLMNIEMTTVKDMKADITIENKKVVIIITVASPLVEVEEVIIKENTRVTAVQHIIVHMWYEQFFTILEI